MKVKASINVKDTLPILVEEIVDVWIEDELKGYESSFADPKLHEVHKYSVKIKYRNTRDRCGNSIKRRLHPYWIAQFESYSIRDNAVNAVKAIEKMMKAGSEVELDVEKKEAEDA